MRAENWEDRVDGADIDDNGGEMEGGSEGVKKKKTGTRWRDRREGGKEGGTKLHLAINWLKQLSVF